MTTLRIGRESSERASIKRNHAILSGLQRDNFLCHIFRKPPLQFPPVRSRRLFLFMSHPISGLFQPRCADFMAFYCLPAGNKLYIHLDGTRSIFLVAYELRNVIWTAVSISGMYMWIYNLHAFIAGLLFHTVNTHCRAGEQMTLSWDQTL